MPIFSSILKTKSFVYRVETEEGVGMYNIDCEASWQMQPAYTGNAHPGPFCDKPLYDAMKKAEYRMRETTRFGFTSPKQLNEWIYRPCWKESLHAAGAGVSVYLASLVFFGEKQCVFDISEECYHERKYRISLMEV
jgi:hypothetical protein